MLQISSQIPEMVYGQRRPKGNTYKARTETGMQHHFDLSEFLNKSILPLNTSSAPCEIRVSAISPSSRKRRAAAISPTRK